MFFKFFFEFCGDFVEEVLVFWGNDFFFVWNFLDEVSGFKLLECFFDDVFVGFVEVFWSVVVVFFVVVLSFEFFDFDWVINVDFFEDVGNVVVLLVFLFGKFFFVFFGFDEWGLFGWFYFGNFF